MKRESSKWMFEDYPDNTFARSMQLLRMAWGRAVVSVVQGAKRGYAKH